MILLAAILLTTQSLAWTVSPPTVTVGDTVRLTRRVEAEPEARSAILPLAATETYVPLAAPVVAYSEGAFVVRYRLAFFQTGIHAVSMPDLELSLPDGRTNVIPGDTAWINVSSVIPAGEDRPQPRPSLGPFSRTQRSLAPAVAIVSCILILLAVWAIWRRRTAERPLWSRSAHGQVAIPLQQWIMAGESKAAVGVVTDRLRDAIEVRLPSAGRHLSTRECMEVIKQERQDWPTRDIEEVLRSLDRAQYAPAVPSDVALLVDQVEDLLKAMDQESTEVIDE